VELGGLLLLLSIVLTGFAAVISLQRLARIKIRPLVPRLLSVMAAVVAIGTMSFLFYIFLTTDLSYEIVWAYSSEDMPTAYKLSGSWAGQAGSMVLWSSMLLIFWMFEELRWWRRERLGLGPEEEQVEEITEERKGRKGRSRQSRKTLTAKVAARKAERKANPPEGWLTMDLVRAVVMLVALVVLMATMALEPFAARTSALPAGGHGLNPALRTPLMAIHPPIVFLSYAMITIVFGAAMAYVIRKDDLWSDIARPWTRLAWFTLTLGIGIGAMWAYETLGWGGYWAWDPVETSSLLPWISLTALLHALVSHGRRRDYTFLAPFLAGMSMFLVFFATFVTRSGVWASVHSYAGASSGTAIDRVAEVLAESTSLRYLYYGMWIVLIATLASVIYRFKQAEEDSAMLPERGEEEPFWEWLARWRVSMFATIFLLAVSMVLILMMLVGSAGGSVSPGEYDVRIGMFAVPLMAFLVICMAARYLERRKAIIASGLALLAGVLLWAINPGDLDPGVAWLGATVGMFGIAVVLGQAGSLVRRSGKDLKGLARRSGSIILHLGLAMLFMAYCLSNVPTLPSTEGTTWGLDDPVEHGEYEVLIEDRSWIRDTGVTERNEYWDTFDGRVVIKKDGNERDSGRIEVISSWKNREYGTLTWQEDGNTRTLNGEVVASDIRPDNVLIRFQSFRDVNRTVVVDLLASTTEMSVWPALWEDSDILEGQFIRLRNETETWEGFLRSVDGPRGDVTIYYEGEETVIPGPQVKRLYRRAYVSLEMTDVFIYTTLVKDVYISVLSARPLEDGTFVATVMVIEVPAMVFLWTGMFLMSGGVLLRPLETWGTGKKKGPSGPEGIATEGDAGDGGMEAEVEDLIKEEDEEGP
jgi:cytochrome c-type biogenesis protein CcmF